MLTDPLEQLRIKYLSTFEDKYLKIKKALDEKDHATLSYLIHQLAGSSGSYGFQRISDACSNLEQELLKEPSINPISQSLTSQLLNLLNQANT